MDLTIIWIIILAWAASCIFYLSKISKIAHSNRLSLFSPLHKYNRTLRGIVKKLYLRIIIITIFLFLGLTLVFYMRDSLPE